MATSSTIIPSPPQRTPPDGLRLQMSNEVSPDGLDGSWWPRSRDLQREAADLVDHFPAGIGRISRMLFSRPDWDNSSADGRGVRSIRAARGPVKVGSFPSDDTHLMILTLSSRRRLKLLVIPSDTPDLEAADLLVAATGATTTPPRATRPDETNHSAPSDDQSPAG